MFILGQSKYLDRQMLIILTKRRLIRKKQVQQLRLLCCWETGCLSQMSEIHGSSPVELVQVAAFPIEGVNLLEF